MNEIKARVRAQKDAEKTLKKREAIGLVLAARMRGEVCSALHALRTGRRQEKRRQEMAQETAELDRLMTNVEEVKAELGALQDEHGEAVRAVSKAPRSKSIRDALRQKVAEVEAKIDVKKVKSSG